MRDGERTTEGGGGQEREEAGNRGSCECVEGVYYPHVRSFSTSLLRCPLPPTHPWPHRTAFHPPSLPLRAYVPHTAAAPVSYTRDNHADHRPSTVAKHRHNHARNHPQPSRGCVVPGVGQI
jgi:hypothetical protein